MFRKEGGAIRPDGQRASRSSATTCSPSVPICEEIGPDLHGGAGVGAGGGVGVGVGVGVWLQTASK